MSNRRNRLSTRYELSQQLPRLAISGGCLLGSFLLLGMLIYIAWQLFIKINPPLAQEPGIPNISETSDSAQAVIAPPTTASSPVVVSLGDDGSAEAQNSAESEPTPAASPTANFLSEGIGGGNGRIAYVSNRDGNFEIYSSRLDGSDKVRLTDNWFGDWRPTWSPDGSQLLFHSKRDGNWEIYRIDADGSNLVNLTNNPADDSFGTWSPDGTQIAFHTNREGDYDIYVINTDGSEPRNYYGSTVWNEYGPRWSPDGTKLLFSRQLADPAGREIFVINTDGTGETQLTDAPFGSYFPIWSPDGAQVAFHSNRTESYEIFLMQADGSDVKQLTNNTTDDFFPAFSPDGEWLIYHSNTTGGENGDRNLVLISVDGLREQTLLTSSDQERMPAWQP